MQTLKTSLPMTDSNYTAALDLALDIWPPEEEQEED